MFPAADKGTIQRLVASMSTMESVIEVLLSRKVRPPKSAHDLLDEQAEKIFVGGSIQLDMNRSAITNRAKTFYKTCVHRPSQLRKTLSIKFDDEDRY